MAVSDRWHKTHPKTGEARCGEHRGKVPTAVHGLGRRWQVRYRDQSGEQKAQNFDRQVDAEAFDSATHQALASGTYVDMALRKTTLAEFAQTRWLPAQVHLRPGSAELYGRHLRVHILPKLGKRALGSLRAEDVRTFVAALRAQPSESGEPLAAATITTVVAVLKMVLETAVTDRLIASNPARRVPLPRIEHEEAAPMPKEDVLAVANAIRPRYRVMVMIAAMSGLRMGEVLGLREPDVDFLRRKISVRQQAQNGTLVPLKTRASRRVVPVDNMLLEVIAEHMRQYPRSDQLTIVVSRSGQIPSRAAPGEAWRAAVRDAGLPAGTRFHGLRHFYASVLIAANLNAKVIQARLGHSSITETMDTYGHLFPEAEELGRGVFDSLFRGLDVHGKCTGEASA